MIGSAPQTIAHFDCIAGVSGDMILGALIDAGADFEFVAKQIARLGLGSVEVRSKKVTKNGIGATQIEVTAHEGGPRTQVEARRLIETAGLPDDLQSKSLAILERLAAAEARVHSVAIDEVHFHEIGAADTIVDIVGSAAALSCLLVDTVTCSAIAVGSGSVQTEHGLLPVPSPAVSELLKDAPIYGGGVSEEVATPTGAAILAECASVFGPMPMMTLRHTGYGAGTRDLPIANVLRVMIGEAIAEPAGSAEQVEVEATIDDMNPELFEYVIEKLYAEGAQDAWIVPAIGKRGRPASILTALVSPADEDAVREVIFTETSTLGMRSTRVHKWIVERSITKVLVQGQMIRVKMGTHKGRTLNVAPEYSDCASAARRTGLAVKEIYRKALLAAEEAAPLEDPSQLKR